jgi:hypothetical protein
VKFVITGSYVDVGTPGSAQDKGLQNTIKVNADYSQNFVEVTENTRASPDGMGVNDKILLDNSLALVLRQNRMNTVMD